jgi:hypothetical protein
MDMSLTIFLAICILGIDVMIYFLYEWAFGESERIRKRHASRLAGNPAKVTEAPARIVDINHKKQEPTSPVQQAYNEAVAYRRLAASFATIKPRP